MLVLALVAVPLAGAGSRTRTTNRRRTSPTQLSTTHRKRHSSAKAAKSTRKSRRPNAYQRLAKMQIDPSRVQNIQRALSEAGAYHGSPTGQWDAETRDAMTRYQTQNGFGVTGLPDAKSLMKLGLGPHPLPAELDKRRAANLPPNPASATNPVRSDAAPAGDFATPGVAPLPADQDPPKE